MEESVNSPAPKRIFSSPLLSPILFLIATLGFFLTFTDINCNGKKLDSVTGVELATGYKQDFDINKDENSPAESERYDPNIFALNALIAAVLGLIIFAVKKLRSNYGLTMIISIIGFICMIMMMIDLKTKIANAQKDSKMNIDLNIEFKMKFGYWLVTFCFFVLAVWNFLRLRESKREDLTLNDN